MEGVETIVTDRGDLSVVKQGDPWKALPITIILPSLT